MKKTFVKHPGRLFVFGAALLALLLAFNACENPQGSGSEEPGDPAALVIKITEAGNAKTGIRKSADGADVPNNIKWVTQTEMDDFDDTIEAAEEVTNNPKATQTTIDRALGTLQGAITTFMGKLKDGSRAAINTSALITEITTAGNTKNGVLVSVDGTDVAKGAKWVTQVEMKALDDAIEAAEQVRDTAIDQTVLDNAVTPLNTAITTFTGQLKDGAKESGFTTPELTGLVERAKAAMAGVFIDTNRDDYGPLDKGIDSTTSGALETAISTAESLSDETLLDTTFTTLNTALLYYYVKLENGNIPNKTALNETIRLANAAKAGVEIASSKAGATAGSKWAAQEDHDVLNQGIYDANIVNNNTNASVKMVNDQTTALSNKTRDFNDQVGRNGLGTRDDKGKVTVTGMEAYNGMGVGLGLVDIEDISDFSFTRDMDLEIDGDSTVIDGRFTVQLYNEDDEPWTAAGSYLIGFMVETEDRNNPMGMDFYAITSKHNFSEDPAPTFELSRFSKPEAYSFRPGGFTDEYPSTGLKLDSLIQMMSSMMSEGKVEYKNYSEFKSKTGVILYENKALTDEFSGGDIIYNNTVIWAGSPFWIMSGGGIPTDLATLKGTFTLTDLPPDVRNVTVRVDAYDRGSFGSVSERYTTVKNGEQFDWEIPVTSIDLYEMGEADLYGNEFYTDFYVTVMLDSGRSYDIRPNGSRITITIPEATKTVENIALGSLKAEYITMSGTLNVKYNNSTVTDPSFIVYSGGDYSNSMLAHSYFPSGTNQSWEILLLNPGTAWDAIIDIQSYNDDDQLFWVQIPIGKIAANEDKLGVDLNIGNLMPNTLTVMNAPARIYSVEAFNKYNPNEYVGENKNVWGGSVSTANWNLTNGSYGFVIESGDTVKTSRPVHITDGIAVVDWNTMTEVTDDF